MKTTALLITALLLAGCATKKYRVCLVVHDGLSCMHHDLSRPDAVNVGNAVAELGYDVVVERNKGKLATAPTAPPNSVPRDQIDPAKPNTRNVPI